MANATLIARSEAERRPLIARSEAEPRPLIARSEAERRAPMGQQLSLALPGQCETESAAEKTSHHHELDRLLKTVMALDRGRVLRWVFLPELCQELALPEQAPVLMAQLDKEFPDVRRFGDYLLEVEFVVLRRVAHFEFQKRRDPQMGERMVRYQVAARLKHGLDLVSLVLNMVEGDQAFRREAYVLGPVSQIGWVDISVPRLVGRWPESTDSPMAEMLRALVGGPFDRGRVKRLLGKLGEMGLGKDDCRQVMLMLSFLHGIQHGQTSLTKELIDEELSMLELEDSFLYQAGVEAGKERYLDEGKRAGLGEGTRVMKNAISMVCDVFGIAMTEPQRRYLETLSLVQLEQLHRSITQTRAWPAA